MSTRPPSKPAKATGWPSLRFAELLPSHYAEDAVIVHGYSEEVRVLLPYPFERMWMHFLHSVPSENVLFSGENLFSSFEIRIDPIIYLRLKTHYN